MSDVLQKSKRKYFNNLNEKNTFDNKKFWKVIESLLSNRIISNEKVTMLRVIKCLNEFLLVENVDILKEMETLQSNRATQNLNLTKSTKADADIFAEFVFTSLNKCIEKFVFQSKVKLVNLTPVN